MRVLTIDVPHLGTGPTSCTTGASGWSSIRRATPNPWRRRPPRPGSTWSQSRRRTSTTTTSPAGCASPSATARSTSLAADEDVEFARIGVRDNETLAFGDIDLRVIATPGHTPLHLSYLATDATAGGNPHGALFSGGSLLHGAVGRTDLIDPTLTTALTRAQWLTARRLGALARRDDAAPDPRIRQLLRQRPAASADGT